MCLKEEPVVRVLDAIDADNARVLIFGETFRDFVVDFSKIFLLVLREPKRTLKD